MPHQKHGKNNRLNANRGDANNNVQHQQGQQNDNQPVQGRVMNQRPNNARMVKCCVPTTCPVIDELIDTDNVGDAVRVFCNSEICEYSNWMHKSCFDEWEQSVLSYLRSCGRARSWSEKQRLQNLWTKKGYDLAFKACDCNCGRGHIRKDLDYVPPVVDNAPRKQKKKKQPTKPELTNANVRERRPSGNGNTTANGNYTANGNAYTDNNANVTDGIANGRADAINGNAQYVLHKATPRLELVQNGNNRLRSDSVGSTGSSPPDSTSSGNSGSGSPVPQSPQSRNGQLVNARPKFEFSESASNNTTAGSIFRKRNDLSAFNVLPKHKQNSYHIRMEEDTANGNDEVRSFVLDHLSTYRMTSVKCVLCKNDMAVFDRFPLVDGTLFLSPQAYDDQVLRVISEGRLQFINPVCISCLEGATDIRCASCKRKWDGSSLLLGTMYSYDIFAAMPCCQKRLTCKHCRRAVVDITSGLQYFSEYSRMIPCPYCKAYDYHFIRPLAETFALKMSPSIWN